MLDYLAVWMAIFNMLMLFTNLWMHYKLIDHIKQTDNARSNMEREGELYEKMRIECELARDSYDTRLATLNNAEKIAKMLAGKGNDDE